jgi:hypothetical protein
MGGDGRDGVRAGYDSDSVGAPGRRGKAEPTANKNHPKKMYHGALSKTRNGIGSDMGSTANTPMIARHPEITNTTTFGACKVIGTSREYLEALT